MLQLIEILNVLLLLKPGQMAKNVLPGKADFGDNNLHSDNGARSR